MTIIRISNDCVISQQYTTSSVQSGTCPHILYQRGIVYTNMSFRHLNTISPRTVMRITFQQTAIHKYHCRLATTTNSSSTTCSRIVQQAYLIQSYLSRQDKNSRTTLLGRSRYSRHTISNHAIGQLNRSITGTAAHVNATTTFGSTRIRFRHIPILESNPFNSYMPFLDKQQTTITGIRLLISVHITTDDCHIRIYITCRNIRSFTKLAISALNRFDILADDYTKPTLFGHYIFPLTHINRTLGEID